jgi:hypothetical protein
MQLPDDRLLATASEGTVFLVLAWQEMFDAYVPDTFQPRLFNLPLLIDELQSVAHRAEASPQWEPHMQAIQAEMAQALQWDRTFLGGLPYFRWAANTLVKESTPKQLVEATTTLQIHRGRYQELAQRALLGTAGGRTAKRKRSSLSSATASRNYCRQLRFSARRLLRTLWLCKLQSTDGRLDSGFNSQNRFVTVRQSTRISMYIRGEHGR